MPTDTITINENTGGVTHTNTADAIFAVISHGANRSGAFPINSATQNTRSADASETLNDVDNIINVPKYSAQAGGYAVNDSTLVFESVV